MLQIIMSVTFMHQHLDEFCDHCAKKRGLRQSSFVGLARAGSYATVACKDCGITEVDHQGRCLKCPTPWLGKTVLALILVIAIIGTFLYF